MTHHIELQVGMDFLIVCTCGYEETTKLATVAETLIDQHEAETGHVWE